MRVRYNEMTTEAGRMNAIALGLVVSTTQENPLLATDVYKMGHMEQYCPGTEKVYSHLVARIDKNFEKTIFTGLQYYLQVYLSKKLKGWMAEEFLNARKHILGSNSEEVERKIRALAQLGYFPIEIKAVQEGTVMPVKHVLMTITNTLPGFGWVVGFIESLILKVWDTVTVSACGYIYRGLVDEMWDKTVDDDMHFLKNFAVHDFGYRGCKTEEEAGLSGMAFLAGYHGLGSDTVPALPFIVRHYMGDITKPIMLSVPASEHSVMCSFGREDELAAFRHMLKTYPSGIVSIVSDTFNIYRVLTEFAGILKEDILARPEGSKVVFRPDSGNPEYIICGDPSAPVGSPEWKGAIRLLDEMFGTSVNKKGYKVLNPKVGLIYGDGMYFDRFDRTLRRLEAMGYAASNLVIGVGGILRGHSRDSMGFAIKATYVVVGGIERAIMKDPITDSKKKSLKGLMTLVRDEAGNYQTIDEVSWERENTGLLSAVFRDGEILREYAWEEVLANVASSRVTPSVVQQDLALA
jgi:nicotinamide phosphoribosyltransferase